MAIFFTLCLWALPLFSQFTWADAKPWSKSIIVLTSASGIEDKPIHAGSSLCECFLAVAFVFVQAGKCLKLG